MRNINNWKPTKYIVKRGHLYSYKVDYGSLLIAQLVADLYSKYIPLYCKGHLIDIGCGAVPFYGYYRDFVSDVTTVDWSNSNYTNEYVEVSADLNSPPIPEIDNESFETAILSDVLEHIFETRKILEEINRILKREGILILNVPFYHPLHGSSHDYFRYTEYSLKRYLHESGFEIIHLLPIGGAGAVYCDLNAKLLGGLGFCGRFFARILQKCVLNLRQIKPIRKFLMIRPDLYPLGYFIIAKKSAEK
jgi:SAM-dependent methyltransferase